MEEKKVRLTCGCEVSWKDWDADGDYPYIGHWAFCPKHEDQEVAEVDPDDYEPVRVGKEIQLSPWKWLNIYETPTLDGAMKYRADITESFEIDGEILFVATIIAPSNDSLPKLIEDVMLRLPDDEAERVREAQTDVVSMVESVMDDCIIVLDECSNTVLLVTDNYDDIDGVIASRVQRVTREVVNGVRVISVRDEKGWLYIQDLTEFVEEELPSWFNEEQLRDLLDDIRRVFFEGHKDDLDILLDDVTVWEDGDFDLFKHVARLITVLWDQIDFNVFLDDMRNVEDWKAAYNCRSHK